MRSWLLWVVLCLALNGEASAQDEHQPPPAPASMKSIFNGTDLDQWDGDPSLWSVRDGAIRGETTTENPIQGNTFLIWTGGKTANFDLRLSVRCNASNNSGIQYRSKHIQNASTKNLWVVRGYQHEVRNEVDLPNVTGFIYDEGGKGERLCLVGERAIREKGTKVVQEQLLDGDAFRKLFRLDDWNDVVIRAEGNRLRHYLNGRLILDFVDADPQLALADGILALQLHAGKPMWVEFRDVRIGELP